MNNTSKQQVNARLPAVTIEQLNTLIKKTGMTKTQVIILAIDRLASTPKK